MKLSLIHFFLVKQTIFFILILSVSNQASASTELTFSSWLPSRHPIMLYAFEPWIADIEKVTAGRVKVRLLRRPLGTPSAHFDLAAEGVADITYGLHSFTTDNRFERSRVGQFSFLGEDAEATSAAFWTVYSEQLDAQSEHAGTHVLSLFVHGPGLLHNTVRPLKNVRDLSGLKLRVPGGYVADLLKDLGVTTLFMSSGEVYERLSRGVIDGAAFTYEALTAFNLTQSIKYVTRIPGGVYNTTWFVVINETAWNALSEEDKIAINQISGEHFARRVGAAWNRADAASLAEINAAKIEIADASLELMSAIKEIADSYEDKWIETLHQSGFDGKQALETLRQMTGMVY